jgi:hypothetical protein
MPFTNDIKNSFRLLNCIWFLWIQIRRIKKAIVTNFGKLCTLCAIDQTVVHIICRHKVTSVEKMKFVHVVVFEKNRLEKLMPMRTLTHTRGHDIRTK